MSTAPSVTPIDPDFFCDGHCAVLLSQSLAGSGMDPHALADTLGEGEPAAMQALLEQGICLPIFFGGDCALDGGTLFVVGELDAAHAQGWAARLSGWLSIPCGRLVLLAGGGVGDELAQAISGAPAAPDYCIYQQIAVPPGDYRVDVLAYPQSLSVALLHGELGDDELAERYAHLPEVEEHYVVQLTPLQGKPPQPELVEEIGWLGVFVER